MVNSNQIPTPSSQLPAPRVLLKVPTFKKVVLGWGLVLGLVRVLVRVLEANMMRKGKAEISR